MDAEKGEQRDEVGGTQRSDEGRERAKEEDEAVANDQDSHEEEEDDDEVALHAEDGGDDNEDGEPSNFQVFHLRSLNEASSSGGRRSNAVRNGGRVSVVHVTAAAASEVASSSSSTGARPRTPMTSSSSNKTKEASNGDDVSSTTTTTSSTCGATNESSSSSSARAAREAMNEYWCQFQSAVQHMGDERQGDGGKDNGGPLNEDALSAALESLNCGKPKDQEDDDDEDNDEEGEEVAGAAAVPVATTSNHLPISRRPRLEDDELEEIKELELASSSAAAAGGQSEAPQDLGNGSKAGRTLQQQQQQQQQARMGNNIMAPFEPTGRSSVFHPPPQPQYQAAVPAAGAAAPVPPPSNNGGGVLSPFQQHQLGMYNWQSTKMTVKERLSFMFNNEILADVHFVVGRERAQQTIPAHRFVLSVGSAVFDAMFNSTLATTDDEIVLPDVEPASFLVLLRFLYSDEVQIGPETVMTTLYTAKKYAVPALEKHCVDFLKRNLSADNAFMLLTQARLFDEPQLAALCLETIDKCTPEALNAEGFIDIDIDTLSAVLDRDSLRIKEAKLFTAVLRWSEAECMRQGLPVMPENKRSVLGHVLTKIRFPLMTIEEFAQGPAQSGILTDRECVSVFLHFTVNPKPPVAFLDIPRCSMTGKEQTVCRFQHIESRWGYSGTSDKIRFIVDRRIFVVGFGLYGSIHGPSEYQVTIQIFHTGSGGRQLGSNELSFLSDGTNSTFRVMFKEPIEILPNTNYTASATLKGLDSHYGTRGMRKVWVDSPSGGKVTFQFSYAAGNNNGTSVEDGQIPEIIFYT